MKKIQYLIGTGEIELVENSHYKWLLDEYITDYMIYASITELIPILSFKINNMGANRTEDEKVYSLSYNEVFALQDHYKHQADYFKYRLQRFLIAIMLIIQNWLLRRVLKIYKVTYIRPLVVVYGLEVSVALKIIKNQVYNQFTTFHQVVT